MTPKVLLFIVLIAVLAPVYLLFGVATSKNIKDMSEKNKEEYEKNRAKHRYMLLGQCWGMGIGVIVGCIANYCISRKVSTGMCLGTSFGMLVGMAIGAMLDRRKMEQETEQ